MMHPGDPDWTDPPPSGVLWCSAVQCSAVQCSVCSPLAGLRSVGVLYSDLFPPPLPPNYLRCLRCARQTTETPTMAEVGEGVGLAAAACGVASR
jgi:hypothetical protein